MDEEHVKGTYEDAKGRVKGVAGSAQEALRPLTKEIEARIQSNPTGAVLMAAGADLLLSLMMGRR